MSSELQKYDTEDLIKEIQRRDLTLNKEMVQMHKDKGKIKKFADELYNNIDLIISISQRIQNDLEEF